MSSPPDIPARERILSAAMDLFMEHGFAATTTLEIATRAGVSKREIYAQVGNKEEMLAICVAERGRRMRLPLNFPAPKDREGLRTALRLYGATMLREVTDPAVVGVFRLGIAEAKRSPAIAQSILSGGRGPARAALHGLLEPAQGAGLIAAGDLEAMNSHFHALLWGDLMVWVLLGAVKSPTAKEIERRAEDAASLFMTLYGR